MPSMDSEKRTSGADGDASRGPVTTSAETTVEVGQVWIDPDTGLGWTVIEDDESGFVTVTAVVEQSICTIDLVRKYRLDPPDMEPIDG